MPLKIPRLIGNRSLFFPSSKATQAKRVPYRFFSGICGIPLKKRFESLGVIDVFHPQLREKPTVASWFGRAAKQLNDWQDGPETTDLLIRFMQRIRRSLWFGPSEYQTRIMNEMNIEGELNAD